MNHDALTQLRRLDAAECDRALAHAYDLHKRDGFAATERGVRLGGLPTRVRHLTASAILSLTRAMERMARALEHANQAHSGEQMLRAPERNLP